MTPSAADEPPLLAVVRDAWIQALPGTPFDPAQSWEAAGADSLRSLHLVMNLETALGRKVPFDLISRQMTAHDLARLLAAPEAPEPDTALPTIFLVPGVFGDGPILAEFRRSFGGALRFSVVELPDMDVSVDVHMDLPRTGQGVAAEIERRAPSGDLHLAGFSYGGMVAFEAAQHLVARGRTVAFIGLLDSFTSGGAPAAATFEAEALAGEQAQDEQKAVAPAAEGRLARMLPRRGEGARGYAERLMFGAAVATRRLDVARRITVAGRKRLSQDQQIGRRKIVLGLSRLKAIARWTPRPLDVPAFLACTDEGAERALPERWGELCPRLDVVRVPGRHLDIFAPASLALLTPGFLRAVAQTQGGGPGGSPAA